MTDQAKKQSEQVSGVSNMAYNLLTLLHNKLEGIAALEAYKVDAQGNQEVSSLLDELQQTAVQDVSRIKPLLVQELGS
ncbi:MAG TPA: hypothetical protein VGR08_03610 [Thermomicrobiales bacterium]|nr:hypothetical protein [Thermomicrobiales bacterium]